MRTQKPRSSNKKCPDWKGALSAVLATLPPDWHMDPRGIRLKNLIQELPSPDEPNLLESRLREIDLVLNELSDTSQKVLRSILPDIK